ncbi:unnamed protein product [Prorocentrum cordatum]|uniref:Uncharacterized protein n=1 Tax=Prorocentrum cordatum TaxID=2364126 RepID=A0ABN9RMZ8_9DINO|nr:unnamed protein product [Polarella glacialis]
MRAERSELEVLLKGFVAGLVQGQTLPVVTGGGLAEDCRLSLSENLLYFRLETSSALHEIPLRNVRRVWPGQWIAKSAAPAELDDLCDTLVLRNNECVTFRMRSVKERYDRNGGGNGDLKPAISVDDGKPAMFEGLTYTASWQRSRFGYCQNCQQGEPVRDWSATTSPSACRS